MAPFKNIKTYEKKLKSRSNISTMSITIKKKRLKLQELPQSTTNGKLRYFNEDSLNVETEDTFDKLIKGKIYNEVQIVNTFRKNSTTSDSELYTSYKKNKHQNDDIAPSELYKNCKKKKHKVDDYTPIMTRSKSKRVKIEHITNSIEESNVKKTQSNSENERFKFDNKQTSLDRPVDISLSIEKEQPNHATFSSLSYINISKLMKSMKPKVVSSTPYILDGSNLLPNTVSPIQPNSDQQQQHDDDDGMNISNNITPKLPRRSSRKRDTKLNYAPRRVLLDQVMGFNDNESQESIEKSKQYKDFIQSSNNSRDEIKRTNNYKDDRLENMQPIVVLTPPTKGFNDQCVNISANDSNQIHDIVNSMIEQQRTMNLLIESEMISSLFLSYSNCNKNENSKFLKSSISCDNRQHSVPINQQSEINNSIVNKNDNLDSSDIIESSIIKDCSDQLIKLKNITVRRKRNDIKPGKLYRRSLVQLQKSFKDNSDENDSIGEQLQQQRRRSTLRNSQIIPLKTINKFGALLQKLSYVQEKEERDTESEGKSNESIDTLENCFQRQLSLLRPETLSIIVNEEVQQQQQHDEHIENCSITTTTAKDIVLRKCQQTEPIPFEECYPNSILNSCHKLGEGVYGEVFLYKKPNGTSSVLKIIPIEGDIIVNGERQKSYEEVLSEIIISLELSNLRTHNENQTTAFVQVETINCVYGQYPDKLIDLWDLYDETKGSENDSPEIFPKHQIYIVLELANAGQDAESFVFNNAQQALSMFKQVACALAIAEIELQFEHRDLHWGNILIKKVDSRKKICFIINQQTIEICSNGIEVTIIDYTLSRAQFNGVVIYNDLSKDDELFKGTGDHQFEIYRLMQDANRNNWQDFQPRSNIFWLHYLLMKMIDGLRYLNIKTKTHRDNIKKIQEIESEILNYDNVVDFVNQKFVKKSKIC